MRIKKDRIIINNKSGFTLMEVMVAVFLFAFLMIMVGSSFTLAQRSYNKGATENELAQNIRVSLDRLTREIRQSVGIITILPPNNTDPLNPPADELMIQDGHDISQITYIRYYLSSGNLSRRHFAYFFDEEPTVYVTYNATDPYGNPPQEIVISDQIIGEYGSNLDFWGGSGQIFLTLELTKNNRTIKVDTTIFSRNE